MSKGTPSFGRRQKKTHIACRRCGRHSYHIRKKVCSACSFGKSPKLKKFSWQWKSLHGNRTK